MIRNLRVATAVALVAAGALVTATFASADGTEQLGPPSIAIAPGTGLVVGGVGLVANQPGTIDVQVPVGATVEQVLLYWEGFANHHTHLHPDVTVDGIDVSGVLIGGPTNFFWDRWSSTYRADITGVVDIGPGANQISVGGLDFAHGNHGAGVMVIYDDGTDATVDVRDGNDLAYRGFDPPLDATVPQVFTFPAETVERQATLSMFFSSVAGPDLAGPRPNTIEITTGSVVTEIQNQLSSVDGHEWDTFTTQVTVPAGATSVKVQAFSDDRFGTGLNPASFVWNAAALTLPHTPPPPPPPPAGGAETAWAADGTQPGQLPYNTDGGNWATYVSYKNAKTTTLFAGRTIPVGTVTFSGVTNKQVTITIELSNGWSFDQASENLKVQDYKSAPSGNPAPGLFDHKNTCDHQQTTCSIVVPANKFYGVHVGVVAPPAP
jgi:hypothetical protein